MKAWNLRHRVAIQRKTVTRNSFGDDVEVWADHATVWAQVSPVRGAEALRAGVMLAEMDTRINIRWAPNVADVSDLDRVLFGGVIYGIVSAAQIDTARDRIELMCKSGANRG